MNIEYNIERLIDYVKNVEKINDSVFLSLGKPNIKAKVKLLKKPKYLKQDVIKEIQKFRRKTGEYPIWVKIDVITHKENVIFKDLKDELINVRRNYVDFGFALDKYWNLSFIPEEINANAFLKPIKNNGETKLILSEQNINNYLHKYTNHKKGFSYDFYKNKEVVKFKTKGFILEEDNIFELCQEGYKKGLRKIKDLHKEIDSLIESSTKFLKNMLLDNGKYIYGYFPHFDREIDFYNILRHSSSTYALIEGLSYLGEGLAPVEKSIDYLIENNFYEKNNVGYIYDDTNNINEIKLGQNAAFVFTICEYLKYEKNEKYLNIAQKVARGILSMINEKTYKTVHILNYPDLTVKEEFRIIYYDGEAALALLRLYQQDNNDIWLKVVKKLMDQFIAQEYWKYHDHWLGYCTNELVKLTPEYKYFEFGIKNVNTYLDYIEKRETTFPTFLEMLTATYKLIQTAKKAGFEEMVQSLINEKYLIDVINKRADYQRVGFFYPEIAMYFKKPSRILGSFFIKHHGYRVRIDDIEHYISGYVQYQKINNTKHQNK
ncbi:poly(glycerol-phosphate) alpha-glucosyltransferase [Staphylococcus warneri]|uniref:poly(glycerol-phosphate) alpha-glucosyltransferase n=1 Tax=Staphylococcus warneri TaxID=1292 RepID=UPI000D1D1C9B|nr:poly(glycerol-phosphate) alpha-glucosyltransferase [Staphylococcus warneri]PTI16797.1 poly(glycerol-phosphate) alpha-glucosyltransferase [Staphylococcus warneri]PTI26376.1 poly(glycerol-phosphate) alpha-glucosyltransferase [Staphylococcus warneri]RIM99544.1 poly(glycerol-phosphate) alpha-glucosyltransferase [Staphylococcus warneri]